MTTATKGIIRQANLPVVTNDVFSPIGGHATETTLSAVKTISPGLYGITATADKVILQADGQNVRYTLSASSTPTATFGFLLRTTDAPRQIILDGSVTLRVIEAAGGATLQMQFGT